MVLPFSFPVGRRALVLAPPLNHVQEAAMEHFGERGESLQEGKTGIFLPVSELAYKRLRDPPAATKEKGRALLGEPGIWVARSRLSKF